MSETWHCKNWSIVNPGVSSMIFFLKKYYSCFYIFSFHFSELWMLLFWLETVCVCAHVHVSLLPDLSYNTSNNNKRSTRANTSSSESFLAQVLIRALSTAEPWNTFYSEYFILLRILTPHWSGGGALGYIISLTPPFHHTWELEGFSHTIRFPWKSPPSHTEIRGSGLS